MQRSSIACFEGFVNPLDDTAGLFYCGMSLPEAELVSMD
jgi:hypothetical protein